MRRSRETMVLTSNFHQLLIILLEMEVDFLSVPPKLQGATGMGREGA